MRIEGGQSIRPTAGRHGALLDDLGRSICSLKIPEGTVLSIDDLSDVHGVSRSVVREAIRVLASMGLVASKRGVGTTTQPLASWNLFDPQVIQWRLNSPDRLQQLRELAELRIGFEPEAAALAALHVDQDAIGRLMGLGAQLWSAAHSGDTEEFLRRDIAFHSTILEATGNPMYRQYAPVVRALLLGRAEHGLAAIQPTDLAVDRHMTLLRAIQTGDPDRARMESRTLIVDSLQESREMWQGTDEATRT